VSPLAVLILYSQINSQIVRAEERAVLTRLLNIMVSLDLRFLQERTEDGQLTYRLDPYGSHLSQFASPLTASIDPLTSLSRMMAKEPPI
jgi:hypothetical protein